MFKIPFHAGLYITNGNLSVNYMGKNYQATEVNQAEALLVQDSKQWETLNYNFSGGVTIGNNVTVQNGNVYQADSDGDVVMGKTYIGDKIVRGNNNVIGHNNTVNWS